MVVSNEIIAALDGVINNLPKFEKQMKGSIDNTARKRGNGDKKITQEQKINVFLFDLCCSFRTIFFSRVDSKNIRVHVRHYIPDIEAHRVVMSLYGDSTKSGPVSDIDWKEKKTLIHYSYNKKKTFLSSLNPDMTYKTKSNNEWDDFLTLAINYMGYKLSDIPPMSFGISFVWNGLEEEDKKLIQNTLYCLSYVGLGHTMENIIEYANKKLKLKEYFNNVGGDYVFK